VLAYLREGVRIGLHGLRTRFRGHTRYPGDAEEICRAILAACWDERGFYKTSLHNYPLFYARDFGMTVDALLALGHRERVRTTLAWALAAYRRAGRVTQQVTATGKAFNFPDVEQPDALAFLLHSLVALGDQELVAQYRRFLEGELARFTAAVVDIRSGLVRRDVRVAGMRDYALRTSSCYDNTMLGAIKQYATRLKLQNPLQEYAYEQLLLQHFWTGTHFRDDLEKDEPTGDANVVPFWFRLFPARKECQLFAAVERTIQKLHLDKPVPLRYEPTRRTSTAMHWLDFLTGGWERDTAWLFLGNLYLQVLVRLEPEQAKRLLERHRRLIERHQCYPEVVDRTGELHRSLLFHADDSMLWAANYLALERQLRRRFRAGGAPCPAARPLSVGTTPPS